MRAPFPSSVSRIVRAGALVALAVTFAPRPVAAQTAADNAAALRKSYLGAVEELQGKFLQLAEAIPADKYSWRPAPGVRSDRRGVHARGQRVLRVVAAQLRGDALARDSDDA